MTDLTFDNATVINFEQCSDSEDFFLKIEIWIFLDSDVGILVSLCLGHFYLDITIGTCYF